jgi:hypothetical protein
MNITIGFVMKKYSGIGCRVGKAKVHFRPPPFEVAFFLLHDSTPLSMIKAKNTDFFKRSLSHKFALFLLGASATLSTHPSYT